MALINCLECEKEYSNLADNCPNCGCPSTHNLSSELDNEKAVIVNKKEHPTCDVEIKGSETLVKPDFLDLARIVGTCGFLGLIGLFNSETTVGRSISIALILIITPVMYLIFKPSDESKEDYARALKINEYFKTRFPILKEFTLGFTNLGVANAESSLKEQAMFKVYMQAHKAGADAIVLNSDNTSTMVYGKVTHGTGHTSSSTSFHIMATLVKY